MAGKKATTPAVEEVKQEATGTPVVKQEEATVYTFISSNPYLTVGHLGIQFREGKASTTNLAIAKALAKVGGVEMVED